MSDRATIQQYRYALSIALIYSLFAELVYWLVWGVFWFPGHSWAKLRWATTCGLGMGAVVGAITCLLIVGRLSGWKAIVASFSLVFTVGTLCTINCFLMDRPLDWWGASSSPTAFLAGGLVGTILGGILYSCLVFTPNGNQLLGRGVWNAASSNPETES